VGGVGKAMGLSRGGAAWGRADGGLPSPDSRQGTGWGGSHPSVRPVGLSTRQGPSSPRSGPRRHTGNPQT
jgi:hypothetical protein